MNAKEPIEQLEQSDALHLIYLRNAFYRKKYQWALSVYIFSLLVLATLIGTIFYLVRHPSEPLYFATDNVGRLVPETSLQTPNMPMPEVVAWLIEAVQASYSYDYVNYRGQLQNAQKYFTDYGWRNYMRGLQTSNNLFALTQRKYIIIANVVEPPKLVREGVLAGALSWKFEMPMLLTYWSPPYDDKSKFSNPLTVTVVVSRQNLLQSYKGLGIIQMNAKLLLSTPMQSSNLPET